MPRWIQVGLVASAALFAGAMVVVHHLWPCQLLEFPWRWLPVLLASGLILSAVSLIHRSPGSLNLTILGIIVSLLGLVVSMQPPEPETCVACVEIRKIHGVDAGSVSAEYPAHVPCAFRVTGLMKRPGDVYLFSRQIGTSRFPWVGFSGSGGGAVEPEPTTFGWASQIDLCASEVGTLHELVAGTVVPHLPSPAHPSQADCTSTSEFTEIFRPASAAPSANVVFYVGDRERRLTSIASPVVGAKVFYAGFAEPVAWIDWGDGKGWQRASSKPGEVNFLMNTYEEPGEKKIKFRVVEANSDLSIEKLARIIVERAAPPNQSAP